jgi:hypothetical protein
MALTFVLHLNSDGSRESATIADDAVEVTEAACG